MATSHEDKIVDDNTRITSLEGTHSPVRNAPKPKGILKNSRSQSQVDTGSSSVGTGTGSGSGSSSGGLAWDEANLSLNEVQRDSTMKITEPKVNIPPVYPCQNSL